MMCDKITITDCQHREMWSPEFLVVQDELLVALAFRLVTISSPGKAVNHYACFKPAAL